MDVIEILGGPARVARLLEISPQAVSQWKGVVPHDRVMPIYYATNGVVTPYEMRSDLYPDPHWRPAVIGAGDAAA